MHIVIRKTAVLGFSGLAFLALAVSAKADLVVNGGFESSSAGAGQMDFNTTVTGWSTMSGYTFLFTPGSADTTGANGQYGNLALWGPNNGSANGLPATSPAGGNFIAMDGDFQTAPVTQTINGLTPGQSYVVGFWWAGAQQFGFDGATSDNLIVSLGAQSQQTNPDPASPLNVENHGFSGWMYQTFTFTASDSSEPLSFLASSSPAVPPFVLLDGVTLNATPEPGYVIPGVLMFAVMIGLAVVRSKNRVKA
jgi:hypothetical protein